MYGDMDPMEKEAVTAYTVYHNVYFRSVIKKLVFCIVSC
jgi:hypothetical protein